jgi:hypothetical protein
MKLELSPFATYYRVLDPSKRVAARIKTDIPVKYRFFEKGHWYLHADYMDAVLQFAATEDATQAASDDDFATLYLLPSAPSAIVDAVWKALVKIHHPDVGGDSEHFKTLVAAYGRVKHAAKG